MARPFSFVALLLLMSSLFISISLGEARKLTEEGSHLAHISSHNAEAEAANIKEKVSSLNLEGISTIFVQENGHPKSHISHGESYVSARKALEDGGGDDHSPGIGHDGPPATP
ncbi:hypothetical protein SUGI_0698050 [Cryptomeria japonica]|nr:hypothetical protein SUGI_0698050 [Cryptomeria japonica]